MKNKFSISALLTQISFVTSMIAMFLVVSESKKFTNNNISNNEAINTIKANEMVEKAMVGKVVNNANVNTEMEDLITDIESSVVKNQQQKEKSDDKVKIETISTDNKQNADQVGKVYYGLIKSFDDKDGAILELNKIRVQHSDIAKKYESSVRYYKSKDVNKYGIFFKANGDKEAEDLCLTFEARGLECNVVLV